MKIIINKEKYNKCGSKTLYLFNVKLEGFNNVFLDQNKFNESETVYMRLFNLNNEEFLNENNIDYIKDRETNEIIPIGIIDFQRKKESYNSSKLSLLTDESDELYICENILNNIIKAIKIKYKYIKFIDGFKDEENIITI